MSSNDSDDFEAFCNASNYKNLTEAEYLKCQLGEKYMPLIYAVSWTLVYVAIFVSGVVGNVLTCTVIVKYVSMHSRTDYYLFNLAISDLLLLMLGLPNEVTSFWQQYPWLSGVILCKMRAYVSETSSYVSVLTIVVFSMARYLMICHPFGVYEIRPMKSPRLIIIAIWLIAMILAIPFAIYTRLNYVEYPPDSGKESLDSAVCAMLLPNMANFPLYELSFVLFFVVPILVIIFLYTSIGLKIHENIRDMSRIADAQTSPYWRQVQEKKNSVKMLRVVVILFFVCWAPFHVQRLLYVHGQEVYNYRKLNEVMYLISGCLYYFSTIVNPIVYSVMSKRYRKAFEEIVYRCGRVQSSDSLMDTQRMSTKNINLHRYTLNQAAEMFRLRSNPQDQAKYTRTLTIPAVAQK